MAEADSDLLIRYRNGDVEALGELVERYRRPLFSLIGNMAHGQEEADEIFQEVWFRALRSLDTYKEGHFFGWIARIAHNLLIDRARRRRPTMSLDDTAEEGAILRRDTLEASDPGPERALEAKDLATRLAEAMERLPPEQKEVLLFRVLSNLPFKEIARIQNVSINTALARMHYALAKLRPLLKDEKQAE